jgi:HEAT repeat protein
MSADAAARHARARHPDEETRYRAVAELDPARPEDLAVALERFEDPSWRVRSAAVDRVAALRDPAPVAEALLAGLSGAATIGGREACGAALARIGRPVTAALVERLGSADADLRQAAASVLAQIGDRRTVPALAARLADPDESVRGACADALGRIGGGEAAGALLAALDSDDATLRLAAVEALAALGLPPTAARLEALLANPVLRRPAYRLLGASDERAALDLLGAGIAEPVRRVREAALGAIGRQRDRRAGGELAPLAGAVRAAAARDPGLADGCALALASGEPFVAAGALAVLAWIGEVRHAAAIARAAEDERLRPLVEEALDALPPGPALLEALSRSIGELPPGARISVLGVLARCGDAAALRTVTERASDADAAVQAEAIAALGRLGDARAVSPLAGLLGDDAPGPSSLAASALARVAGQSEEARRTVIAEVRRRAGSAPCAALYRVLGAAGEEEDLALAAAALRSPAPAHRAEAAGAVAALARRGRLAAAPPGLVAALTDPTWTVRAASAHAVAEVMRAGDAGRLGSSGALAAGLSAAARAPLAMALRDPEPAVRARAAEALAACRRAEHVPELAALAGEPGTPPVVAVAALRALEALGGIDGPIVARAAAHPDPEVVKEAVAAAARLSGAEGGRVVAAAAGDERWDVRRAAARAMIERRDPALRAEAARRAASDPDPFVARAFAEAAAALAGRG